MNRFVLVKCCDFEYCIFTFKLLLVKWINNNYITLKCFCVKQYFLLLSIIT